MRTGPREVRAFVDAHRGWIEQARDEMAASGSAADISLPSRIELSLSAEQYGISYVDTRGRARLQKLPGGNLAVHHDRDDGAAARRLLRQWASDRARDLLLPMVARLAARTGLEPKGARIGRQRSRWGSCSSAGRINLNCGLLFVRPPLVEYLIIHELCHLRHLNHSARFWRLVGTHLPGYEALERELAASWTRVPGWLFYDA